MTHVGRPATYTFREFDAGQYERGLRAGRYEHGCRSKDEPGDAGLVGRQLHALAGWLDVSDAAVREVDDILLLPGDEQYRAPVAAALVRAGLGERILLPERPSPNGNPDRAVLEARGVPPQAPVAIKAEHGGTIGDARALATALAGRPDRRVAVVTSFYHLRRTRLACRAVLGRRADAFVYVAAPATCVSADNWWHTEHGTQTITTELVKLAAYWCWFGPGRIWLLAATAVGFLLTWAAVARRRRRRFPAVTRTSSPEPAVRS